MKSGRLAASAVLVVLAISLAPAAFASTLTVDLNPSTQVAKLTSVSTSNFVLQYPANSTLSSYLEGYNSSSSLSGSFNSSSAGLRDFRGQFRDGAGDNVSVTNMTVSYGSSAKANSTALVVEKQTDITAFVSGAFSVSNGTVTADLGWRSFYVAGALDLDLEGHSLDVNLAGSVLTQSTSGRGLGVALITGMFAGKSIWSRATLNFSSLSSPLSNWTRSYAPLTNTTTFSKTVAGNSTFSASYSGGGGAYTLTMTSDPSASISTKGYAVASGNSLVISRTPFLLNPLSWAAAAAAVASIILVGAVYLAKRPRPTAAGSQNDVRDLGRGGRNAYSTSQDGASQRS